MTMQAIPSVRHNIHQRVAAHTVLTRATALAGILSLSMLLGGCNQTPAPAAPAPDASAAAAPPPAGASPVATPAAAPAPAPVPAPAREAAARVAAPALPPAPRQYVVPAGTPLVVSMGQTVSAKNSSVGDSFSGSLAQSVVIKGATVFKSGTPVTGTVTAAKGQGRFKGSGALGIAIRRVGDYPVTTSSYEKDQKGKGKRSAEFIGGGGGGGALIGGLAGGGKGALIGGLLGAGAGTAGALFTGNKDVVVPAESVVTFTLSQSVTVERR